MCLKKCLHHLHRAIAFVTQFADPVFAATEPMMNIVAAVNGNF